MIRLGKQGVVLDAENANGWTPTPGGVTFHFKESASVYISEEMADRITKTFQFQRKKEGRSEGFVEPNPDT